MYPLATTDFSNPRNLSVQAALPFTPEVSVVTVGQNHTPQLALKTSGSSLRGRDALKNIS